MPAEILSIDLGYGLDAVTAAGVGIWRRDPVQGLIHCNPTMSAMFGIKPSDGRRGVPLSLLRRKLISTDRHLLDRRDAYARERGGLMVTIYRIQSRAEEVRWLMARGHYEPAQPGWVMPGGRGIVIDITETKGSGLAEGDEASYLTPISPPPMGGVEDTDLAADIVDRVIGLHAQLKRLPDPGLPVYLCEVLMAEMMQRLAEEDALLAGLEADLDP